MNILGLQRGFVPKNEKGIWYVYPGNMLHLTFVDDQERWELPDDPGFELTACGRKKEISIRLREDEPNSSSLRKCKRCQRFLLLAMLGD